MTERTPWVVGVSGASGTPYARAVLNALLDGGLPVDRQKVWLPCGQRVGPLDFYCLG